MAGGAGVPDRAAVVAGSWGGFSGVSGGWKGRKGWGCGVVDGWMGCNVNWRGGKGKDRRAYTTKLPSPWK